MVRLRTDAAIAKNLRVSAWRRKIKRQAVDYKGGKCQICQYDRCLDALTFHHRNPREKELRFGDYPAGWERLRRELDKCDLLCIRCHVEVHAKWRERKTREQEEVVAKRRRQKLLEVPCSFCKKTKMMTPRRENRSKSHFCNHACRGSFMRKAPDRMLIEKVVRRDVYPDDETLGRMVWKEPACTVAAKIGVSGTALKKHCKTRHLETPPRGYWSKQQARMKPGL